MNGIVLKRGLKSKSEDNVSIDEKEKETWKRVKLNEVIHSFTRFMSLKRVLLFQFNMHH